MNLTLCRNKVFALIPILVASLGCPITVSMLNNHIIENDSLDSSPGINSSFLSSK